MCEIELVSIEKLEEIRDHILQTYKQIELQSEWQKWLQVTSALNSLVDSALAVKYYCESEYPDEMHGKYLYLYGLLQALFMQQDAISSINKSLFGSDIDFKSNYPEAYKVRELRNDIGHPSQRKGGQYFIFLSQISLQKWYLTYVVSPLEEKSGDMVHTSIKEAISDNSRAMNSIISEALGALENELSAYIEKHKQVKMIEIFSLLGYAREKFFCDPLLKTWAYQHVKNAIAQLEAELILRYGTKDALVGFKTILDEVHDIFRFLDEEISLLPIDLKRKVETQFSENLFLKLSELKSMCAEIDAEFNVNSKDLPLSPSETVEISIQIDGHENNEELQS